MIKKRIQHYGCVKKASLRIQHQGSMKRTSAACFAKFSHLMQQFEEWQLETNQANAILALNMIKVTKENYKHCWSDFRETYPEMCDYIGEKEEELDRFVSIANAGL